MPDTFQDVTRLTQEGLNKISSVILTLPRESHSMEAMADSIVKYLYRVFRRAHDDLNQCALVRIFKTCGLHELTDDLRAKLPASADDSFRSLVLLASCGDEPEWNARQNSRGHQVISLESVQVVESIPMISNLIKMLGLNLNDIVSPNPEMTVAGFYPLSVFYVDEASKSHMIPSQQNFVIPYGICSVIGFGGLLNFSDMFTIIMFFKVPVSREIATMFKDLAEEIHELLLPYQQTGRVFNDMMETI